MQILYGPKHWTKEQRENAFLRLTDANRTRWMMEMLAASMTPESDRKSARESSRSFKKVKGIKAGKAEMQKLYRESERLRRRLVRAGKITIIPVLLALIFIPSVCRASVPAADLYALQKKKATAPILRPTAEPTVDPGQDAVSRRSLEEGMRAFEAGAFDQARTAFERSASERPNAVAHHYLGLVHQKKGRFEDAIRQWKKAVDLDPQLAVACFNIGLAYGALKRPDESIKWYRKAVTIDRSYYRAWNNLGSAYVKKRRMNDAVKALKQALRINPKYAVAAENLALVSEKMGRKADARKYYKMAASLETRPQVKRMLEAKTK